MTVIKFHLLLTSGAEAADVLRKPLTDIGSTLFHSVQETQNRHNSLCPQSRRVCLLNE